MNQHVALRLRYARHWLRFKVSQGLMPHTALLPASSTCRLTIRFHRYGFVAFWPGKSLSVSWRFWAEGPCNFATYAWLHVSRLGDCAAK